MNKILRIGLIVLFAISGLLTLLFYAGGEEISGQPRYTNIFLIWAAILTIVAVGFTIVLPVFQMVANPKNAKKSLIGVAGVVVVFVLAYIFSSGELLDITNPDLLEYNVPSTLKYAGTIINSIYVLGVLAVLSMIYAGVSKMFK